MWPFRETNAAEQLPIECRDLLMHARIGMLRTLYYGKANPTTAPCRKRAKAYRVVR